MGILDQTMNRVYGQLEIELPTAPEDPAKFKPRPSSSKDQDKNRDRAPTSSTSLAQFSEEAAGTIGRSFETMATAVARSSVSAIDFAIEGTANIGGVGTGRKAE